MKSAWKVVFFPLLLLSGCGGGSSSDLQNIDEAGVIQNPAIGAAVDGSPLNQPLPSALTRYIELKLVNIETDLIAIVRNTRSDAQYDSAAFFRYTAHIRGSGTWDTSRLPQSCSLLAGEAVYKTIVCEPQFNGGEINTSQRSYVLANPGETIDIEVVYTNLNTLQPQHLLSASASIQNTPSPGAAPVGFGYETVSIELGNPIQGVVFAQVSGRQGLLTDLLLPSDTYILNLSGNAQWLEENLPANCMILDAPSVPVRTRLQCNIEDNPTINELDFWPSQQVYFSHILPIRPLSDSNIHVELSFVPSHWDTLQIGREDQTASIDYEFSPDPDFQLSNEYRQLQNVYLVPSAESTRIAFRIAQQAPTTVSARVEISASSEFEIESVGQVSDDVGIANQSNAAYSLPGVNTPFCELDGTLICTIPDAVPYNVPVFEFSLTSLNGGDGSLTISIYVDSGSGETLIEQRQFTLVQVQSMQIIQDALSTAAGDRQIELPPGTYGGLLDLYELGTGKTLIGATGSNPTVLVGGITRPIINYLPARTTLSNVILRTYGAQVISWPGANTTIQNSVIEPADSSEPGIRNSLFGYSTGTALSLKNNLIQNFAKTVDSTLVDPLTDLSGETCPTVLTAGERGEFFVRQNTFRNIQCENLITVSTDGNLTLENNNFIDNDPFVAIAGLPWRLHIRNNILSDTYPEIDYARSANADVDEPTLAALVESAALSTNYVPTDEYWSALKTYDYWPYSGDSWLEISNNLVWNAEATNSANNDFADAELRGLSGVIDADDTLFSDPGFVDPDAGNYQLNVQSLAIDAGTQPVVYEWFEAEVRDCFRSCYWLPPGQFNVDLPSEAPFQPASELQIQAHDGNGDGTAEVDIGAHEFGLADSP